MLTRQQLLILSLTPGQAHCRTECRVLFLMPSRRGMRRRSLAGPDGFRNEETVPRCEIRRPRETSVVEFSIHCLHAKIKTLKFETKTLK